MGRRSQRKEVSLCFSISTNRPHCMCQRRGHTVCAKQQDTVYVPNNRTSCMCQTTGHTACAKQQETLYVPNSTQCMCETTGHTVFAKQHDTLYVPNNRTHTCAKQHPGENKPDIQLRKYQSSNITTSHSISVHTHTFISFRSDMLLYFHVCICLQITTFN